MRKKLVKITSLVLILSLLLSSSPSLFLVYGKCDPDDTACKLKKQAKKSCSSADDVEACREGKRKAQTELSKIQAQKQAGMVTIPTEITDPEEAGDLAWASCKLGGGSDADCRAKAEKAYLEVEKSHPVDAATKEAHIIRDTLRKTALEEAGGSEALTAEQAERIRRESDIASTPVLKEEYQQNFNQQMIAKYGQDVTDEEIKQFYNEYYQQNRDRFELPLTTESDLTGLGKDLLNRASVSEYLDQQLGPEPEPEMTEEQRLARIESNVQYLVNQKCQLGDLVVELENAMDYSGYYRCRDGQKITPQEASRLRNTKSSIGTKEKQLESLEAKNQDYTPYTAVTQLDIQYTGELLTNLSAALNSSSEERGIANLPEDLQKQISGAQNLYYSGFVSRQVTVDRINSLLKDYQRDKLALGFGTAGEYYTQIETLSLAAEVGKGLPSRMDLETANYVTDQMRIQTLASGDGDEIPDVYEQFGAQNGYHLNPNVNNPKPVPTRTNPDYNLFLDAAQRAGIYHPETGWQDPSTLSVADIKEFQRQLYYVRNPFRILDIGIPTVPVFGAGIPMASLTHVRWADEDMEEIWGPYRLYDEPDAATLLRFAQLEDDWQALVVAASRHGIDLSGIAREKMNAYLQAAYPSANPRMPSSRLGIGDLTRQGNLQASGFSRDEVNQLSAVEDQLLAYFQEIEKSQEYKDADTTRGVFAQDVAIYAATDLILGELLTGGAKKAFSAVKDFFVNRLTQEIGQEALEPFEVLLRGGEQKPFEVLLEGGNAEPFSVLTKEAQADPFEVLRAGGAAEPFEVIVPVDSTAGRVAAAMVEEGGESLPERVMGRVNDFRDQGIKVFNDLKKDLSGILGVGEREELDVVVGRLEANPRVAEEIEAAQFRFGLQKGRTLSPSQVAESVNEIIDLADDPAARALVAQRGLTEAGLYSNLYSFFDPELGRSNLALEYGGEVLRFTQGGGVESTTLKEIGQISLSPRVYYQVNRMAGNVKDGFNSTREKVVNFVSENLNLRGVAPERLTTESVEEATEDLNTYITRIESDPEVAEYIERAQQQAKSSLNSGINPSEAGVGLIGTHGDLPLRFQENPAEKALVVFRALEETGQDFHLISFFDPEIKGTNLAIQQGDYVFHFTNQGTIEFVNSVNDLGKVESLPFFQRTAQTVIGAFNSTRERFLDFVTDNIKLNVAPDRFTVEPFEEVVGESEGGVVREYIPGFVREASEQTKKLTTFSTDPNLSFKISQGENVTVATRAFNVTGSDRLYLNALVNGEPQLFYYSESHGVWKRVYATAEKSLYPEGWIFKPDIVDNEVGEGFLDLSIELDSALKKSLNEGSLLIEQISDTDLIKIEREIGIMISPLGDEYNPLKEAIGDLKKEGKFLPFPENELPDFNKPVDIVYEANRGSASVIYETESAYWRYTYNPQPWQSVDITVQPKALGYHYLRVPSFDDRVSSELIGKYLFLEKSFSESEIYQTLFKAARAQPDYKIPAEVVEKLGEELNLTPRLPSNFTPNFPAKSELTGLSLPQRLIQQVRGQVKISDRIRLVTGTFIGIAGIITAKIGLDKFLGTRDVDQNLDFSMPTKVPEFPNHPQSGLPTDLSRQMLREKTEALQKISENKEAREKYLSSFDMGELVTLYLDGQLTYEELTRQVKLRSLAERRQKEGQFDLSFLTFEEVNELFSQGKISYQEMIKWRVERQDESLSVFREQLFQQYGFTQEARDYLVNNTTLVLNENEGARADIFLKEAIISNYSHEPAVHEIAHLWWQKEIEENPEIIKSLVFDLIKLSQLDPRANSQYNNAIRIANIYVYGTEKVDGWKGMFCNADYKNINCASDYLNPTDEDISRYINNHEIFAGLASWHMGQYKSGSHALPDFMWKYFEPLFTGEIQIVPYYEVGHSFQWPSLVKKIYAQEKTDFIPVNSLIYKKVAIAEELAPMIEANPDLTLEEALLVMDKYEMIEPRLEKEGETVKISTGEGGYAQYEIPSGFYRLNVDSLQGYDISLPARGVNLRNKENVVVEIGIREGRGNVTTLSGEGTGGQSGFGQLLQGLRAFLPSLASLVYAEPPEASEAAVLGQKGFGELLEEIQTGRAVESDGVITLLLYHDSNGNGVRETGENNLPWAGVTITLAKETESVAYQLLEGWNFVSFPVVPQSFGTASELITDAARQGAYITTVGRWDGAQWQEYIQRGEEAYGQDFPIEPGVAYMLRNHVHLQTWVVSGFKISSSVPLRLKTGFNGVGIPYSETGLTAADVLDGINQKTEPVTENADLITRFVSGNWDVFIKRIYSEDNIQEYGNDFKILPSEGYFIRVKEEVDWTP